jgi:hypothetical protein
MVRAFARYVIWLSAMLLFVTGTALADTTITFDGLADGTVINNQYAGVTLQCFVGGGGCPTGANVYARTEGVGFAFSGANVVSTEPLGIWPLQQDPATGAIEVLFSTPQSAASIEAMPFTLPEGFGTPGYSYLQAYSKSGSTFNFLGASYDSTLNQYSLLNVNTSQWASGTLIDALLIGQVEGGFPTAALFDNLCYSDVATGCNSGSGGPGPFPAPPPGTPGAPVTAPEPGTILLSGLGLAAFALKRACF